MDSSGSTLSEVLRKDQRRRWSRGERVLVESYVERFPALTSDHQVLLDLIAAEYALRQEFGEAPDPDEYASRFPDLAEQLSEVLPLSPSGPTVTHSGDTDLESDDGATRSAYRTQPVECPACAAPLRLPPGGDPGDLRCPKCKRQIHVLDETLSVQAKAGRRIGAFELLRRVGQGQFGEVWLARDTHLRRDVALKLPRRPEENSFQTELFLREARASARLQHPNIVPVYESGSHEGVAYIVTAFIRGATLKDLLAHKTYTPQEAAELCRTLAQALEHAHQAGIVHRDLKPSNILIDADQTPHIGDFGLAKHSGLDEITVTLDGNILGTPAYMPPEQASGKAGDAGPASDVYSLGVILYELLTRTRPFQGRMQLLLHRILTEEPTPPRQLNKQIPRDLETICLKAMAKSPTARYSSAKAFADDLDRFCRNEPVQARRPSLAERTVRRLKQYWPALVLIAAAGIAGAGLTAGFVGGGQDAPNVSVRLQVGEHEPPSDSYRHTVSILTEPVGAEVVCYPLNWETGRPDFQARVKAPDRSPTEVVLNSGMYLVVAYTDDAFHEVLRTVPRDPQVKIGPQKHERWDIRGEDLQWPTIQLHPHELIEEDLTRFDGAEAFDVDLTPLQGTRSKWRIPAFLIEDTEVTVEKFSRFDQYKFGQLNREANVPAIGLPWEIAVAYAEHRGMRLPDLLELEFLATAGGKHKHAWGDAPPPADNWDFDRAVDAPTHDRLKNHLQVTGLSSGPLEWTTTRHVIQEPEDSVGLRLVIRGGPAAMVKSAVAVDPWASVNQHTYLRAIGLRCARSPRPRIAAEDFIDRVP